MFLCFLQRVTEISLDAQITTLIQTCTGQTDKKKEYFFAGVPGTSLTFYKMHQDHKKIHVTRLDCGNELHVTYGTVENDSGVFHLYISHNIPNLGPLMGTLLTFEFQSNCLVLKVRQLPEHVVLTDKVMYWVGTQLPSEVDSDMPNVSIFENSMYHPVVNFSLDGKTVISGGIAVISNEHNQFGKSLMYYRQRYLLKCKAQRRAVATHIDARLQTPCDMQVMDQRLAHFVHQHMKPVDNPAWSTRFHVKFGTGSCVTDEAGFMGSTDIPQPDLVQARQIVNMLESKIKFLPKKYLEVLDALNGPTGIYNAVQPLCVSPTPGADRVQEFHVVKSMICKSIKNNMLITKIKDTWIVCVRRGSSAMSTMLPAAIDVLLLWETPSDEFVYMKVEMDTCPRLDKTLLIVNHTLPGTNHRTISTFFNGNHGTQGYDVMKARPQAMADLVAHLQLEGRKAFNLQSYDFFKSENASREHHSVNMRTWSRRATWRSGTDQKTIMTSFCILRGLHEPRQRQAANSSESEDGSDFEDQYPEDNKHYIPTTPSRQGHDRHARPHSTYKRNHAPRHSIRGG